MNSDSTFQWDNSNSETSIQTEEEEEFGDGQRANQKLIVQLNAENEGYKQEIYQLQLKVANMTTLQNELQDTIDTLEASKKQLENSMGFKLYEVEEKNKIKINALTTRLDELETMFSAKQEQNIELQKQLDEVNKKLSTPVIAAPVNEISFRNDVSALEDKIQQLVEQISDKQNVCLQLEEDLRESRKNLFELQELYNNTKERLVEQNQALEATRDELTECRVELENFKTSPADQGLKGNSVFAELEDRRQKALKNMMTYKQSYNDIKRTLQVKHNEIKALQAEKAALLTTLQNDRDETTVQQQNANLIEKYKQKISELRFKLEDLRKKYQLLETQQQPIDDKYQYFLTILDAKRKENEELLGKVENVSIQALIDEEMKCKINEQLRFWRQKAIIKEAQLKAALECRLGTLDNSPVHHQELLQIIQQENKPKKIIDKKPIYIAETLVAGGQANKCDDTINPDQNDFEFYKLKIRNNLTDEDTPLLKPKYTNLIDFSSPPVNKENHEQTDNGQDVKNELPVVKDSSNEEAKYEKKGILKCTDEGCNININVPAQTALSYSENAQEKEKKILRFTADTVDPKPGKPLKQVTPKKYPVMFVTKEPTNNEKDD